MTFVAPDEPTIKRHLLKLELRDESCCPGLELIERITFRRRPSEEDLAIVDSYRFRAPVVEMVLPS